MALEALLAKLEGTEVVTPVTPAKSGGVTANHAPLLTCTLVTPVTPKNAKVSATTHGTTWQPDAKLPGWWLEYTTDGELVSSANYCPTTPPLPAPITCATCKHFQATTAGGLGDCAMHQEQRTTAPSERYPAGYPIQPALYPDAKRECEFWEER